MNHARIYTSHFLSACFNRAHTEKPAGQMKMIGFFICVSDGRNGFDSIMGLVKDDILNTPLFQVHQNGVEVHYIGEKVHWVRAVPGGLSFYAFLLSGYSGVAEPPNPEYRATSIPVMRARHSGNESHMKIELSTRETDVFSSVFITSSVWNSFKKLQTMEIKKDWLFPKRGTANLFSV